MHAVSVLTGTGVTSCEQGKTNMVLPNAVERRTVKVISGMVEVGVSPVVATWWDSNPPTVPVDHFYFLNVFQMNTCEHRDEDEPMLPHQRRLRLFQK